MVGHNYWRNAASSAQIRTDQIRADKAGFTMTRTDSFGYDILKTNITSQFLGERFSSSIPTIR